jgi:hypothetical protein
VISSEVKTDYGHDAFLLEAEQIGWLVSHFLTQPALAVPATDRGEPGEYAI